MSRNHRFTVVREGRMYTAQKVEPAIVRLMSHLRRRVVASGRIDHTKDARVVRPAERYEVFCDRDLPGDRP